MRIAGHPFSKDTNFAMNLVENSLVLDAMSALRESWAAGSGRQYAEVFTIDSRYVAFDGTVLNGRHEIDANARSTATSVIPNSSSNSSIFKPSDPAVGCFAAAAGSFTAKATRGA